MLNVTDSRNFSRTFPAGSLVLAPVLYLADDLVNPIGGGDDRVLDIDDFLAAVRRVADGGTAIDPQVVEHLLRTASPVGRCGPRWPGSPQPLPCPRAPLPSGSPR